MKTGILFIISAPSGTGKSSLIHALINNNNQSLNISISTSYTTRNIRPKEINGKHYHFITKTQFKKMIQQNTFIEYTKTFDHYYGTSRHSIEPILNNGTNIILNIDWKGAKQLKNKLKIKICSIFIFPPSKKELERRLRNRNQDNEKTIIKRIEYANNEINNIEKYDYFIINDNFNVALLQLKNIILSENFKKIYASNNKIIY